MSVTVVQEVNQVVPETGNVDSIPAMAGLMKGDIIVYRGEGDFQRLPVGLDGQVLTADSASELGMKWA